jgi:hypothetical protein
LCMWSVDRLTLCVAESTSLAHHAIRQCYCPYLEGTSVTFDRWGYGMWEIHSR